MDYHQYIKKFIALIFFLGVGYLIKLYLDYGFSIWLLDLFLGIYCIGRIFILMILDRKLFDMEHGYSKVEEWKVPNTLMDKLRAMHPKDFEDFVEMLFELNGYTITQKSSWKRRFSARIAQKDGGIDLIAVKNGKKVFIQIKKYTANMVGVEDMRAFYGCIVDKLGPNGMGIFVTTSVFSEDAKVFANEHKINLMDYSKLEKKISQLKTNIERKDNIEKFLSKIDYYENIQYNQNIRSCKKCGAPLQLRKEGFYGCQNYYSTKCDYKEYE